MENLLNILKRVKSSYPTIEISEIRDFYTTGSKVQGDISLDWDEWSGEEWLSLMTSSERVAIIGVKIPIAFIASKFEDDLKFCELMKKLFIVTIDDFDKEIWTIDLDEYRHNIPELEWHVSEDAVNPNAFSTSEFWFATI